VTVGVYTFELHIPGSRSLKDRRQVVRRLKDRLRARHNVAVAELAEHADLRQRAGLMVVSVAQTRDALERLFETVHRLAVEMVPGSVIESGREYIEGADGPLDDWTEDDDE
jgi:uncharacterized protein YlxP (DUF503 family)